MEKILYIYHHLGLGDHIMCNGLVRHYAENYDTIYLFVKPHNIGNVKYMYRDNSNIKFLTLDDNDVRFFMSLNKNNKYLVIGITQEWFKNFDINKKWKTFDEGFYAAANIPLEYKWDKFYFERNIEKEKDVFYNKLKLIDNDKFVFIHDNPSQNRVFKDNLIPKNIKIINPNDHPYINLFDFLYTIKKAEQVHVMNSSFMNIIDCMKLREDNLFLHSYARTDVGDNPNPALKLNWTIYK